MPVRHKAVSETGRTPPLSGTLFPTTLPTHMSVLQKAIVIGLSFGVAGFTGGFIVGRMTSVDYGKPATAVNFAAVYAKWNRIDSNHGSLTLRTGNRVYSYRTGDPEVSKKYLSAIELAQSPP